MAHNWAYIGEVQLNEVYTLSFSVCITVWCSKVFDGELWSTIGYKLQNAYLWIILIVVGTVV